MAAKGNTISANSDNYLDCNYLSSADSAIVADVFENPILGAVQ